MSQFIWAGILYAIMWAGLLGFFTVLVRMLHRHQKARQEGKAPWESGL